MPGASTAREPSRAVAIRTRVRDETGLTASVGVAGTKLLAKLASDLAKPDGLLVVAPGTELEFLHPLPVERLWGVGPATRKRLAAYGVTTVGELAALPEAALVSALGAAHGRHLHALAWNHDDRPVEPTRVAKSIGHEQTFATDVTDVVTLDREVARLADGVGSRLRAAGRVGRTVQLKVRYASFRTITRSRTLSEPTDLAADIATVARTLLHEAPDLVDGVRLLGVSMQQLSVPTLTQPDLFGPGLSGGPTDGSPAPPDSAGSAVTGATASGREERQALERAIDAVRARFGREAVGPLSSRVEHAPAVRENGDA